MDTFMNRCTDFFLSGFHALDQLLFSVSTPLEKTLSMYFPRPAARIKSFFLPIKSIHADKLPLTHPTHMVLLLLGYLLMIQWGPRLIRSKYPVTLYVTFHNFLLTFLSFFMCIEVTRQAWLGKYTLFGNPLRDSHIGMAKILALFYCSKVIEFNDTLIMLLKQNFRQITFLHTYHHASIFVIWWLVTYWVPTGDSYFTAMLNSFIHVIMYGYYFMSGIGMNQVRAIKKYITKLQMTQFCFMMVQSFYNLMFVHTNKQELEEGMQHYPMVLSAFLSVYMVTMLGLFYNFYKKDRQREKQSKVKKEE